VVYRSRYVGDTPLADAEQIRSRSVRYNRSAGITGLLWCGGSTFLQVIEGPTAAVELLFERIAGDRRHDAVSVLFDAAVDERLFENWSVALAPFDDPAQVLDAVSPLLNAEGLEAICPIVLAVVDNAAS
jgi:hypothetical protein